MNWNLFVICHLEFVASAGIFNYGINDSISLATVKPTAVFYISLFVQKHATL